MSDSRTTPPDSAHRALALELDAALANDPLVDELAFVPSATLADLFGPNARTHPPGAVVSAAVPGAFALVEHKLAVAVSALAPLHAFAREALRRADAADLDRTENENENENRGERDDDRRATRGVGVDPDTRADALRLLLLVNGDHATAWNRRKRRLIANCAAAERPEARARDGWTPENEKQKQLVSDELAFCALALSRFPKAQAAWAHRRWVICTFESATRGSPSETRKAVPSRARFASESEVARAACLRKRLNYAAWAHRRWCALGRRGGALAAEGALAEGAPAPHEGASTRTRLVDEELERTERFVRVNVSDYCGLHYRQALLTRAFGASAAPRDWRDEAELASSLIARFPGREALWAHRRFVFEARLRCRGAEGRVRRASDARERETRGDDDDDDDDENENENENENDDENDDENANARFFSALLAEELAFADARVSTRDDSAKDATPDPSAVHPSWAEHPAAEQARFAAAHALWALEAARRAGVRGAVGAAGAARRAAAAEALAAAWPWGAAATRGMRRARIGGSGASLERHGV